MTQASMGLPAIRCSTLGRSGIHALTATGGKNDNRNRVHTASTNAPHDGDDAGNSVTTFSPIA